MKQKKTKPQYVAEFKTFNSQQSAIDIFSKVQSTFLQKFFRYNLIDYFATILSSYQEEYSLKKINNKTLKAISSHMFKAKQDLIPEIFAQNVDAFYKDKSKSFQEGQFLHAFKYQYCSAPKQQQIITEGELVYVQVKIKAEIQKLEMLPKALLQEFQHYYANIQKIENKEEEQLIGTLKNYNKKYLNIFIVYFGDINAQVFRKNHYEIKTINFFNKPIAVRMFVFFVSRHALVDTFKLFNKIENLQYINDLLIQLYEFKREKHKLKRLKAMKNKGLGDEELQRKKLMDVLKWLSIVSAAGLTIGTIFLKLFW